MPKQYHGARHASDSAHFTTPSKLRYYVRHHPQDVVITKTESQQYAGPLPLGPVSIAVGGPDPKNPDWLVLIRRRSDGSWEAL